MSYDLYFFERRHALDCVHDLLEGYSAEEHESLLRVIDLEVLADISNRLLPEAGFLPGFGKAANGSLYVEEGLVVFVFTYNEVSGTVDEAVDVILSVIDEVCAHAPLQCFDPQLEREVDPEFDREAITEMYSLGRDIVRHRQAADDVESPAASSGRLSFFPAHILAFLIAALWSCFALLSSFTPPALANSFPYPVAFVLAIWIGPIVAWLSARAGGAFLLLTAIIAAFYFRTTGAVLLLSVPYALSGLALIVSAIRKSSPVQAELETNSAIRNFR